MKMYFNVMYATSRDCVFFCDGRFPLGTVFFKFN